MFINTGGKNELVTSFTFTEFTEFIEFTEFAESISLNASGSNDDKVNMTYLNPLLSLR